MITEKNLKILEEAMNFIHDMIQNQIIQCLYKIKICSPNPDDCVNWKFRTNMEKYQKHNFQRPS